MSLTNYTDLQTAVSNWMARSDLTAVIPDFITLFESVANRTLRIRQMETTTPLTTSGGSVALPSDYLDWRGLSWSNGTTSSQIEFVHPTYLGADYPTSTTISGRPARVFTIQGGNILVRPYDDSANALSFDYYQKIPGLAANSTNWLMTAWPDLYLAGTLVEAYGYVKDYDQVNFWGARRQGLFGEIQAADALNRGPSVVKNLGPTP